MQDKHNFIAISGSLRKITPIPILQTVPYVDLLKYTGIWYEIASFPQRFQRTCMYTTAEYILNDNGHITIINSSSRKNNLNGDISVTGKAVVESGSNNAKLEVEICWPFIEKYWIIDLAKDYSYSVVSHPSRNYLWILSRTPAMDVMVYKAIIYRLKINGFDITKLLMTPQI
jgi:apolipoprotein D and lipocalin family protein